MSCNDLKKRRTVCHIFTNGSDLIQGRRVGNQAITGHCTISRLDSGDTTVGTWLADGTACIGTKSQISLPCCHSRAGAT